MLVGYLLGFLFMFIGITMLVRNSWRELVAYTASGFVGFVLTVFLCLVLFVVFLVGSVT